MRKTIGWILVALILSFAAALMYSLTNGFTAVPKAFSLTYNEKRILNNTVEMTLHTGDVFSVKHYGKDDRINATLEPLYIDGDYTFFVGEEEYSWNKDVLKSQIEVSNEFFSVRQEENEVCVVGTVYAYLQEFAAEENLEGEVQIVAPLPAKDMFEISIKTSDSTIRLCCRIYALVESIELSADSVLLNTAGVVNVQ